MPKKRKFYEEKAKARGYVAVDKVTKDLTLLVTSDLKSGSSKVKKANKENIQIVSLDDWLDHVTPDTPVRKVKSNTEINSEKDKDEENHGILPGFNSHLKGAASTL